MKISFILLILLTTFTMAYADERLPFERIELEKFDSSVPRLPMESRGEMVIRMRQEVAVYTYLVGRYNIIFLDKLCDTEPQLVGQIPQLAQYCNIRTERLLLDQPARERRLRARRIDRDHESAHIRPYLNKECDTDSQLVEQVPVLAQYCNIRAGRLAQVQLPLPEGDMRADRLDQVQLPLSKKEILNNYILERHHYLHLPDEEMLRLVHAVYIVYEGYVIDEVIQLPNAEETL